MAIENILEQELTELFKETISELRTKLKSGEATASDFKNAIELLKNNGITCEIKEADIPEDMLEDFPEFQTDSKVVQMKGV